MYGNGQPFNRKAINARARMNREMTEVVPGMMPMPLRESAVPTSSSNRAAAPELRDAFLMGAHAALRHGQYEGSEEAGGPGIGTTNVQDQHRQATNGTARSRG